MKAAVTKWSLFLRLSLEHSVVGKQINSSPGEMLDIVRAAMVFFARSCLGKVPGGASFSQRSERATACTIRMQIDVRAAMGVMRCCLSRVVVSHPLLRRPYSSDLGDDFVLKNTTFRVPAISQNGPPPSCCSAACRLASSLEIA